MALVLVSGAAALLLDDVAVGLVLVAELVVCDVEGDSVSAAPLLHAASVNEAAARVIISRFILATLCQHSRCKGNADDDHREHPGDREGQLQVAAHLCIRQAERQPQCRGEWRNEGANHVAQNQRAGGT